MDDKGASGSTSAWVVTGGCAGRSEADADWSAMALGGLIQTSSDNLPGWGGLFSAAELSRASLAQSGAYFIT
jgi:hypothetical protein